MSSGPRLRPSVLAARERLAEGRSSLREQHDAGSPGIQVCARLTDLIDTVVLDLYQSALIDLDGADLDGLQRQISLVPHGGYGRRDIAPFSDVDLMLLFRPGAAVRIKPLARQLSRDIVDAGLDLGFSSRTPAQARDLALQDPKIFTSLAESRFLGGSVSLFTKFMTRFRLAANRKSKTVIAMFHEARRKERQQYGETVYLLKPNVKRSRGCLRDIHFMRWIGFARYGQCEPRNLYRLGKISHDDRVKIRMAREFLLRVRNELHFHAGKSQDVLDRAEQMRLAKLYGYEGDDVTLPVEKFMSEFFEHTGEVRYIVSHFAKGARIKSPVVKALGGLLSYQLEGDFRVGPTHVSATRRGLEKVCGDLGEVLRLMDVANSTNKRISHETWRAIRTSMANCEDVDLSPTVATRFMLLMSRSPQLGEMLRKLHQLGVLEKIVPPMTHARCLLQFNEYHKYTVDEHSIRAVERATEFVDDKGPLGEAYRSMRDKGTLHLALLMHDLGKGFPEDHSEVGARLAGETAAHLGLGEHETETVKFLILHHLKMNHLAMRRDIDDESVVLQFAVDVGSPERLQMLYIVSCADLAAVGPDVLNLWKLNLLTELYRRTRRHLASDEPSAGFQPWVEKRREKILEYVNDKKDVLSWKGQLQELPVSYILNNSPERVAEELELLRHLPSNDAIAWGQYHERRSAVEYTVVAHEGLAPGIFHRLTGALSSTGHEILAADINTMPGKLVLDRFYVNDLDNVGDPPTDRINEVCLALTAALKCPIEVAPRFRRTWQHQEHVEISRLPTEARIDNNTAEKFTIIDIFANDRMGLLYTIAKALFDLDLSVSVAKISTYVDQVVDVFYVTDSNGNKITDAARISEIRESLVDAIEQSTTEPQEVSSD